MRDLSIMPGPSPARRPSFWRILAHFRLEAALFALLIITFALVRFQGALLSRTIRFDPQAAGAAYRLRHYADAPQGGTSTLSADDRRPLEWRCTLTGAYAFPYCAYELWLDTAHPDRGLDLSRVESIDITMDYRGPAATFRLYLKNFDPRYSQPAVPDSLKFNKVEVAAQQGRNRIRIHTSDLGVAEWWITQNNIRPALSRVELDNVTQIEIQTGTLAPAGKYRFRVENITLTARILSQAEWYACILAAWAVLIGAFLGYRIIALRRDLDRRRESQAAALRLAEHAEESARRDYLTQLLNRSGVIDLYHTLAMQRRDDGAFGIVLLDVDHFKAINDNFGHRAGDEVLTGIAAILRGNTRSGDIVGRWGGEEFLLICHAIDSDAVIAIAEKLRQAIEAHDFGAVGTVTASFGLVCCLSDLGELELLVSRADAALYAAKESGRNRVVLFEPHMRVVA